MTITDRKEVEVTPLDEKQSESIGDVVNKGAGRSVAYHLAHYTHRTLQQNLMRLILWYIKFQSEKDPKRETDDRNEATVMLCKDLQQHIDAERGKDPTYSYLPVV